MVTINHTDEFACRFLGKIVPEFMAVVRVGNIKTSNRDQPLLTVSRLSGETTSYSRRPYY